MDDTLQRGRTNQVHEIPPRRFQDRPKDNLFAPTVFSKLIRNSSHADNREMYQVFNMGHRHGNFYGCIYGK